MNYQFLMRAGDTASPVLVHPIYKDSFSIDWTMEKGERFHRKTWNGNLTFVSADFDIIMSKPFDTTYTLILQQSVDNGHTWTDYQTASFVRTDCEIDEDDKKIVVKPKAIDEYTKLLEGYENEFNLIELAPEIEKIILTKRPLIQVYVPDTGVVSNWLAGMTWEQDVTEDTDDSNYLVNTCHFAFNATIKRYTVTGSDDGKCDGVYLGNAIYDSGHNRYTGNFISTNGYHIAVTQELVQSSINEHLYTWKMTAQLMDSSDTVLYTYTSNGWSNNVTRFSFQPVSPQTKYPVCDVFSLDVYARILLNADMYGELSTYDIPSDDIVSYNRNYKKVIGLSNSLTVGYLSTVFSDEKNKYGKTSDGRYYMPPASWGTYYPLGQSMWTDDYSIWFNYAAWYNTAEEKGRATFTLNDAYPLSSVIQVLLEKIGADVTHEATEEYSQFLYSTENPLSKATGRLFITPKSNITSGEYKTPAQKAPITLKSVLTMLEKVYQCYWTIEDGKLRIEHISYYMNGGSYTKDVSAVGYDLTSLYQKSNGKAWGFKTSAYNYDKEDMPERYEFEWMDDCTNAFKGAPIIVKSKFVKLDKKEKVTISNFTSDIDYIMANPENISRDGFALIHAVKGHNGKYKTRFVDYEYDGSFFSLQNGDLAMVILHTWYWPYNMPAHYVSINDSDNQTYCTIQRNKKQTLTFPAGDIEPNPTLCVKNNLGIGNVEKMTLNLCSRSIKATLAYDTEQ